MAAKTSPLALVIDDQNDIRDLIRVALCYEGWRVSEASNGREGLEIARNEVPDLVLIDLMMPSMTGIEFCRKITGELGMNETPVLLISGVNEGAKILKDFWAMPLRHKQFLRKPFNTDELFRAIQSLLPQFKTKYGAAPSLSERLRGGANPSRPAREPDNRPLRGERRAARQLRRPG